MGTTSSPRRYKSEYDMRGRVQKILPTPEQNARKTNSSLRVVMCDGICFMYTIILRGVVPDLSYAPHSTPRSEKSTRGPTITICELPRTQICRDILQIRDRRSSNSLTGLSPSEIHANHGLELRLSECISCRWEWLLGMLGGVTRFVDSVQSWGGRRGGLDSDRWNGERTGTKQTRGNPV